MFRLRQPWSYDDAWSVETETAGPAPERRPQASSAGSFWEWVTGEGSRAFWEWMTGKVADDLEMPLFLPEGSYALVLTSRPLIRSARVLMGNELVRRPSTALMLCDGDPAHALVFGRHTEPTLNSPLLGVPILNYTGYDSTPGIWFFSLPLASSVPKSVGERHPLLIVPLRSELLLDALASFHDSGPSIALWHDEQAQEFIEWCTAK
jgi:hypothetical protein